MPVILVIFYTLSKFGLLNSKESEDMGAPDAEGASEADEFVRHSPWIQRLLMVYSDALIAMPITFIVRIPFFACSPYSQCRG